MKKVIIIIVIALVASGVYFITKKQARTQGVNMTVSGTIENAEVTAGSTEGGRVVEVFVKEGARLEEGDEIVRLSNTSLESALGEAEAAVGMAESSLTLLKSGYPKEDIEAAQAAVSSRESQYDLLEQGTRQEQIDAAKADAEATAAQYENARRTLERQEKLFDSGVVSKQTVDNAQAAARLAQERLNAAKSMYEMAQRGPRTNEKKVAAGAVNEGRARLRKLEKGPRAEEIAQAEAAVEQARARLRTMRARVADLVVRAPSPCVVDVFDLYPGDLVPPGGEVAKLVLSDNTWIDVYIPADRLSEAEPGKKVRLAIDSYPGKAFTGKVRRVSRTAEFTPRNVQTPEGRASQVFRTRIDIADPGRKLRAGMTASVIFADTKQDNTGRRP